MIELMKKFSKFLKQIGILNYSLDSKDFGYMFSVKMDAYGGGYFVLCLHENFYTISLLFKQKEEDYIFEYKEYYEVFNLFKKCLNYNKKNLIIFCGCFNPLTSAHYEVAKKAVDFIDDSYLVFVPACDNYLEKHKHYKGKDVIDGNTRCSMITESYLYDDKVLVDSIETNANVWQKTMKTIYRIHNSYKSLNTYFIVGSDDVKHMAKWWNSNLLLEFTKCLVVQRNLENIKEEISKKLPNVAQDKFIIMPFDFDNRQLSSTIVRNFANNNEFEKIENCVPRETLEIYKKFLKKENKL